MLLCPRNTELSWSDIALLSLPRTTYQASSPITLFIIQAGIIIIFCRLLYYPLKLLAQPRVIAEVIGGILLGPSVMMRIPGFQNAIFPTAAMPVLNNVANLGLILFLFLTGLEVRSHHPYCPPQNEPQTAEHTVQHRSTSAYSLGTGKWH